MRMICMGSQWLPQLTHTSFEGHRRALPSLFPPEFFLPQMQISIQNDLRWIFGTRFKKNWSWWSMSSSRRMMFSQFLPISPLTFTIHVLSAPSAPPACCPKKQRCIKGQIYVDVKITKVNWTLARWCFLIMTWWRQDMSAALVLDVCIMLLQWRCNKFPN